MYGPNYFHQTADDSAVLAIERRVGEASPQYTGTNPADARTQALRVATWLTRKERWTVGVSILPGLRFLHRDVPRAVGADLANGSADAVILSAALTGPAAIPQVAALVAAFPSHAFVGLVGEAEEVHALRGALSLGQAGVPVVVDVRRAEGWTELRQLFARGRLPDTFMRSALSAVLADVEGRTDQNGDGAENGEDASGSGAQVSACVRFFRAVFSPQVRSAKQLAAQLGVQSPTLVSRFYRAALPSPKRYLAYARLVWAAHLGECPGLSISAIADRLSASSPQSFGRAVRQLMGMSAGEFRRAFNGPRMLDQFRATLVAPYREILREFDPVRAAGTGRIPPTHGSEIPPKPTSPRGHTAVVRRVA